MRKLLVVFVIILLSFSGFGDVSLVFSKNSTLFAGLIGKGLNGTGKGIFGNPSVIAFSRNFELTVAGIVMPYDRFGGVFSSSFGLNRMFKEDLVGSIGISAFIGGVNNIEVVDENAQLLDITSSFDYGVLLSYGVELTRLITFPFSFGVNAKYISSYFRDISASGMGIDLGVMFHPFVSLPDLGVSVSIINLFSTKNWSTGSSEMLPTRIGIGAFYYLFDDALLLSIEVNNTSLYSEIFSFRWVNVDLGVSFLVDRNLSLEVVGRVGNEFSINLGVNYSLGGTKVGVMGWIDGIGINSVGFFEVYAGHPKYLAKSIDPEVQRVKEKERLQNLEREYFSKAMMYFSMKEYKEAKRYLEEVLKINPNNTTARSLIKKIEDILSLEE